jgi:drug/metabolite transporter (DMT)-like permease
MAMPAKAAIAGSREQAPAERPLVGIGLKTLSVAVFVCMSTLIKESGQLPTGQIAFFRSFFALVPLLLIFGMRGQLRAILRTERPFGHAWRALVGVASMWLSFYGLTHLPLPEAITLNYAQPLAVVALGALIGETVRIYRWSAVILGFAGVVIVSWPNLSFFSGGGEASRSEAFGALAILAAAFLSAIAMLFVRLLVKTERAATVAFYFSLNAAILSLLTFPFGWEAPTLKQLLCLIGAGICGGVAQLLLSESYRQAEMSTIAPFEYTSMLLAIASGYIFFDEIPTPYTIVGGAIVVSAGLFVIWRERRLGLPRGAARKIVLPH